MAPSFHRFTTRQEAALALAEQVAAWLKEGVAMRGRASLAVSGGSTPQPFFEALGDMDLPWEHIYVTLADERWVPPDSEDSNEKLVRAHMKKLRHFVPLKNSAPTPAAGEAAATDAVKALLPFDVVILGMGEDGHTASLFPHHPALEEGLKADSARLCLGVENSPKPPSSRLSLTYTALTDCRQLILHVTGQAKRQLLDAASENGPVEDLPIRRFLSQTHVPLDVYWAA